VLRVTIPDTLAHKALIGATVKSPVETFYGVAKVYLKSKGAVRLTECTLIIGGLQRLTYTFPDDSCIVMLCDYGPKLRPNRYELLYAVATLSRLAPCLREPYEAPSATIYVPPSHDSNP
jgi:hypothetical protein